MEEVLNTGYKDGHGDVDDGVNVAGVIALGHGKVSNFIPIVYVLVVGHLPTHFVRQHA